MSDDSGKLISRCTPTMVPIHQPWSQLHEDNVLSHSHASNATVLTVQHPGLNAQRAPSSSCAPGAHATADSDTLDSDTLDSRPTRDRAIPLQRRSDRTAVEGQRVQQRPAAAHGSWPCEQAASGSGRAARAVRLQVAPVYAKKATPDLRKGRERDPVSPATQKSRAARLHTSPSKDIGCCSCAELAMPEQQRSCQHSTEHA